MVYTTQVNNVIDPFKYTEVPFGSKTELKDYLKVSRGLKSFKRSKSWATATPRKHDT